MFSLDVGDGCHPPGTEQRASSLYLWRQLEPESRSSVGQWCERLGSVLKKNFTFATR
jgi:hypothetical protein